MKEQAQKQLKKLLELMGIEARLELFDEADNTLLIHISSPESSRLIGREARMLDALQLLINRMVLRGHETAPRIVLDVERYRERQKDRLLSRALGAAEQVERSGRIIVLPPMNAAERRIIHRALAKRDTIRTTSEETDVPGVKRVVIQPGE